MLRKKMNFPGKMSYPIALHGSTTTLVRPPLKVGHHHDIFSHMRFAYKMWFEMEDKSVFGMGLFRLLTLVKQTGSLHKAAQELKMSYRAAWGKIRVAEEKLGVDLLEKGRHGRTGAHLTDKGDFMVTHFEHLISEMDAFVTKGQLAKRINRIKNIAVTD